MSKNRIRALLFVFVTLSFHGVLQAQNATPELKLDTGKEIFEAGCIGCHGPGGKGQPQSTLGFEPPSTYPDFSDCNGSVREKNFTGARRYTKADVREASSKSCLPSPKH